VRVLSYEPSERLLDVTLDPDVVRGGRTKARKAAAAVPRAVGLEVAATVHTHSTYLYILIIIIMLIRLVLHRV
jgi:hypothetical protein